MKRFLRSNKNPPADKPSRATGTENGGFGGGRWSERPPAFSTRSSSDSLSASSESTSSASASASSSVLASSSSHTPKPSRTSSGLFGGLTFLPSDALLHVATLLPPRDLCTLCCVSRRLRMVAESDHIWRPLTLRQLFLFDQERLIYQLNSLYSTPSTRSHRSRAHKVRKNRRHSSQSDESSSTDRELAWRLSVPSAVDDFDTNLASRFWKTQFQHYCVQFLQNPVAQTIECVRNIRKSHALKKARLRRHQARLRRLVRADNQIAAAALAAEASDSEEGSDGDGEGDDPRGGAADDSTDSKITSLHVLAWPIIAESDLSSLTTFGTSLEGEEGEESAGENQSASKPGHPRTSPATTMENCAPRSGRFDRTVVVAGTIEDCVDCYDARTGEILATFDSPPHTDYGIRSLQVVFVNRDQFMAIFGPAGATGGKSTRRRHRRGKSVGEGSTDDSSASNDTSGSSTHSTRPAEAEEEALARIFGPGDERLGRRPLVLAASGKILKLWDLETAKLVHVFAEHVKAINCLAFARYDPPQAEATAQNSAAAAVGTESPVGPTQAQYFAITGTKVISVWNIFTGENVHTLKPTGGHVRQLDVTSLQMLPSSGSQLLMASASGDMLRVWDIVSGRCLRTLAVTGGTTPPHNPPHYGQIMCLQALIDPYTQKSVAVTAVNSTLALWDLTSGDPVRKLVTVIDQKAVKCVHVAKGAIACGLSNGYVKIYDYKTGDYVTTLVSHEAVVTSLQIFNGAIFTASSDGTIKIWRPT